GQPRAAHEVGPEEGKALDVDPVGVADQEVGADRPRQLVAELADARAAVDDDQLAGRGADLDAGGVPAVAQGVAAGRRAGASRPPELHPHRWSPSSSSWSGR